MHISRRTEPAPWSAVRGAPDTARYGLVVFDVLPTDDGGTTLDARVLGHRGGRRDAVTVEDRFRLCSRRPERRRNFEHLVEHLGGPEALSR